MFASPQFKADVLTTERNDGLVIIDTPPLGLFADALTIAAQADAVLLVIDATRSRRRRLRRTLQLLGQLGVRPIGVVINRTRTERVSSYYRSAKERADRETAVSGRLLRAPR
jgi:Mrp family chromosome partitioning ATPase